jgi:hypothetical protein
MNLPVHIIKQILSNLDINDILSTVHAIKSEKNSEIYQEIYDFCNHLKLYKPRKIVFENVDDILIAGKPSKIIFENVNDKLDLIEENPPQLNLTYANCRTDQQLEYVAKSYPNLIILDCSVSKITDLGIKILCDNCPNLMYLSLRSGTDYTDAGLENLSRLKNLISIDLYESLAEKNEDVIRKIINSNMNLIEIDYDDMFSAMYEPGRHTNYRQIVAYGHCDIKFNFSKDIDPLLNKEFSKIFSELVNLKLKS